MFCLSTIKHGTTAVEMTQKTLPVTDHAMGVTALHGIASPSGAGCGRLVCDLFAGPAAIGAGNASLRRFFHSKSQPRWQEYWREWRIAKITA